MWCSQFESEKPSRDAGFRAKLEPGDTTLSRQEMASGPSQCPADQSIQQTCGISDSGMARPGLEPGTPRFSDVRPEVLNGAETPANKRVLARNCPEAETRKFHCLRSGSGDAMRLISQCQFGQADTCVRQGGSIATARSTRHALRPTQPVDDLAAGVLAASWPTSEARSRSWLGSICTREEPKRARLPVKRASRCVFHVEPGEQLAHLDDRVRDPVH